MASEEMSFENVDDGIRMPAYTISSPMSFWLKWAKKLSTLIHLFKIVFDNSPLCKFEPPYPNILDPPLVCGI